MSTPAADLFYESGMLRHSDCDCCEHAAKIMDQWDDVSERLRIAKTFERQRCQQIAIQFANGFKDQPGTEAAISYTAAMAIAKLIGGEE